MRKLRRPLPHYGRLVRGDEQRVVAVFAAWLEAQGWTVAAETQYADLYAERASEQRFVEAKGRTAATGLDVDTLYGQLLRRMIEDSPRVRYYVVAAPVRRLGLLAVDRDALVAVDGSETPCVDILVQPATRTLLGLVRPDA